MVEGGRTLKQELGENRALYRQIGILSCFIRKVWGTKTPIAMSLKTKLESMKYIHQIKKVQEILNMLTKVLILTET